ncbi:MAG TPA: DNA polymerase III subunit delta [Candidatus Saccharimonadales bacterium]|nr:DNA polymerase III subunit delta [Candidatus Saccharimonadales bacterium]
MITTLTGDNSWALQQELNAIVSGFIASHGELAVERIDGEEADFVHIQESLTSLPFLVSKKLVVLRIPSANKKFVDEIEALLNDSTETTEVVIVEPKLDKRLNYYKYLKKNTEFKEFLQLDFNGLSRWLIQSAKKQGGTITSNDARYLLERIGPNQQLLANELEKLLLHDTKISRQSIDLLTEPTPQSTVFQLLEAAFAGNAKRTLQLYHEQRQLKVEPLQIVAMLTWQLHVLAVIKTAADRTPAQIAKEAHLSPYVVQKSIGIARHMTIAELKKHIENLLTIDVRSKRDGIDIDEALQHYLLTLAVLNRTGERS